MQRQLALPRLALLLLAAQLPSCGAFWGSSPSPSPSPLSLNKAFDYCIVGAGPGGLQLGHYMHQQSRDYVIFERQPIPCPFFARFPVHRQLISLNKRFTGRDNEEVSRARSQRPEAQSDRAAVRAVQYEARLEQPARYGR